MSDLKAGQPEKDSAPSLRDSISSAFDAVDSIDAAPSTPSPDTSDAAAPAPVESEASGPSDAEASPPETPTEAAAGEPASGVSAKPAADVPKPPPGFPGGDAAWNALAPDARNWVKQREVQVERYIRTNAEAAKFGGAMWNAMRPYEAMIRATGAHPAQVVQGVMNQHFALAQGTPQQKAAVIQGLAQQYGVDLTDAIGQAEAPQVDPEVQQLRQMVGGLANYLRSQEEQQAQAQFSVADQAVQQFASDSQRRHMNDPRVTAFMADLIERGWSQSLEDAYDKAVGAFPDLRAVLHEQDAARRANAARTAAHAAPARGGAPVAASMAPSNESVRATIERAWDSQTSRRVA